MRTFATYIFYFFAVFAILWELLRLFGMNSGKILKELLDKFKAEKAENEAAEKAAEGKGLLFQPTPKREATINLGLVGCSMTAFMFAYWLWLLVGLMSSQWKVFLALIAWSIALSALTKLFKKVSFIVTGIYYLDAVVSLGCLIFIVVNRFHLGWVL